MIRPHCICLHEIKNGLPRTKHCLVPCSHQQNNFETCEKCDHTWNTRESNTCTNCDRRAEQDESYHPTLDRGYDYDDFGDDD